MVAIPYSRWHIPMYAEIFMKVPEDMGMSMADGVNGGVRRGLSRQSRSQSRLVNLIDALVGIDSTKEDPFMLLTIRQGFFVQTSVEEKRLLSLKFKQRWKILELSILFENLTVFYFSKHEKLMENSWLDGNS